MIEGVMGPTCWMTPDMISRRAKRIMRAFDALPRWLRDKINEGKPISYQELKPTTATKLKRYIKAHY